MSWINLKLITITTTEMNQLKTNYNIEIVATAGDKNVDVSADDDGGGSQLRLSMTWNKIFANPCPPPPCWFE